MALFKVLSILVIVMTLSDCLPYPDTSTLSLGMLLKKTAEKRKAGVNRFLLLSKLTHLAILHYDGFKFICYIENYI